MGGIPTLVKLCNSDKQADATLEQVVGCLGNLSEDSFNREEIGDSGGVETLLLLVSPLRSLPKANKLPPVSSNSGSSRSGSSILPLSHYHAEV